MWEMIALGVDGRRKGGAPGKTILLPSVAIAVHHPLDGAACLPPPLCMQSMNMEGKGCAMVECGCVGIESIVL